ncbi:MAG: MnmC family methyltransferase [Cyanobacteria bacterium P01_F01_bin.53]
MESLSKFEPVETFKPVETKDGSSTFYSPAFGEWYHNREGAYNEARETYAETAQLARRAQGHTHPKTLNILDICYGLGYNTAAALETILAIKHHAPVELKALEIDIEVSRRAIAQGLTQQYPPAVQSILQAIATHQSAEHDRVSAQLLIGDARQQIQYLLDQGWQADVIFLDPFSPPNCPQLWTVEFLQKVAQCLNAERGVLITYSCAAAVRTALTLTGLEIGAIRTGGRRWPGTIARYPQIRHPQIHHPQTADATTQDATIHPEALPPLSQQEIEHLQTRAAVPYRDPTLRATAVDIRTRRSAEQANSTLLPTQPWRRRWQARKKG